MEDLEQYNAESDIVDSSMEDLEQYNAESDKQAQWPVKKWIIKTRGCTHVLRKCEQFFLH
jgi:hypothetical protein